MPFDEKTDEELQARLREIGRPGLGELAGLYRFTNSNPFVRARQDIDAWTAANPALAEEYSALAEELSERDQRRHEEYERRVQEDFVRQRIENSGAGSRNLALLNAGLGETAATTAVHEWLGGGTTFLLLCGSPGVGKSAAAMLAVKRYAEDGRRSSFVRAVECSRLSMFDAEDKAFVADMRRVPLLVLDDLGVEGLNDCWRESLEDVMDARYQEKLATVLTTNLPPVAEEPKASFRKRYGERIADRIRHDGIITQCGNETLRKRQP
jgi:DNA replication protein DnaC